MHLWTKFLDHFCEDTTHRLEVQLGSEKGVIKVSENSSISNEALILLEDKVLQLGGSHFKQYGLPPPLRSVLNLDQEERSCVVDENFIIENEQKRLPEQKTAFDIMTKAVHEKAGGIFFIDAPGGTGKTFLINLLLSKVRSFRENSIGSCILWHNCDFIERW